MGEQKRTNAAAGRLETLHLVRLERGMARERFPLGAEPVRIGRGPENEIAVTDEMASAKHAVIRRDPDGAELRRLGPLVERHPRFPSRTNVQLVRVDDRHELSVGVWERGAGETLASGTSSCAAAAAAIARGWCTSPVTVHLAGGDLLVSIDPGWNATLTGPAQELCTGEVSEELAAELTWGTHGA